MSVTGDNIPESPEPESPRPEFAQTESAAAATSDPYASDPVFPEPWAPVPAAAQDPSNDSDPSNGPEPASGPVNGLAPAAGSEPVGRAALRRAKGGRPRRRVPRALWILGGAVVVVALAAGGGIAVVGSSFNPTHVAKEFAAEAQDGSFDQSLFATDGQADAASAVFADLRPGLRAQDVRVVKVQRSGDRATALLSWTWTSAEGTSGAADAASGDSAAGALPGARAALAQGAAARAAGAGSSGTSAKGTWTYSTDLGLVRRGGRWKASPAPSALYPALGKDTVLSARAQPAARGQIFGADDKPLTKDAEVVEVGVQPSRVEDVKSLTKTLGKELDIDGPALRKRIEDADKAGRGDQFLSVITLRRGDYNRVSTTIRPLPGTLFRTSTRSLSVEKDLAGPVLGRVGQASAEQIEKSGGALRAGDEAGLSGMQRTFDGQLRGRPGYTVTVRPAKEAEASALSGDEPAVRLSQGGGTSAVGTTVGTLGGADGGDVHTTLDLRVQNPADAAAARAAKKTGKAVAIVALDTRSGHVVAAANAVPTAAQAQKAAGKFGAKAADGKADDKSGEQTAEAPAAYDRALTGRYAPGSVFKIVTTGALLGSGTNPDDAIACPDTTTVEGKTFKNSDGHVQGKATLAEDFAQSCNTAFIASAGKIPGDGLAQVAKSTGMTDPQIGVPSFGAAVPTGDDAVEHAASMIGQGKVLASPLGVATLAAAIKRGESVAPQLVLGAAGESSGATGSESAGSSDAAGADANASGPLRGADGKELSAGQIKQLREMMRGVVTTGTGTKLKNVPGGKVYGKTGTAEYGDENPPRTHSWFAGFQGDLAFSVLVEDGGFGAAAAAPAAADFLRGVDGE
mgnify:CR=1 FL=1